MKKKIILLCMLSILPTLTGCKNIGEDIMDAIFSYIDYMSELGSDISDIFSTDTKEGKGKIETTNGNILDGYFHEGKMVSGKATFNDGSSGKGLRGDNGYLLLGKYFYNNGQIEYGEYDNSGGLSYGMRRYTTKNGQEAFEIKTFKDGNLYDGYAVTPNGCFRITNGQRTEITKTVTNTVYRNVGFKSALNQQGTILNPYVVNLRIKDY